jgi:site-specific recombinase XerD
MIEKLLADDMPSCLLAIAGMHHTTALRYAHAYKSFFGSLESTPILEFLQLDAETATKRVHRYYILHKTDTASTLNVLSSALKTLIREARRYRETSLSVDAIPTPPVRPHAYRDTSGMKVEDFRAILSKASPRDRIILMLLGVVGLRRQELSLLNVGDFDLHESSLMVQSKGLNGQREKLMIPSSISNELEAYLSSRKSPRKSDALITSDRSKRLSPTGVHYVVQACVAESGIRGESSPHRLRHTAATLSLDAGASIEEVQSLMRHRNASTTQIYDSNRKRYSGAAANKLMGILK